ncbi:MAG TPA: hypothetical protein VGC76_12490 [Pyrinomonadaceae bacterium]|jgi:hypothetical protein
MQKVKNLIRSRVFLLVIFAITASTVLMGTSLLQNNSAGAKPEHEVFIDYYDSTWSTVVGHRDVTCFGVFTTGQVTQYYVAYDGDSCGYPDF